MSGSSDRSARRGVTHVSRTAFDEAIALGHHWAGEEHFLLALVGDQPLGTSLLAPLGLTHAELAAAVTALIDEVGSPIAKEFEGCLSAPSYHTILGRAEGFALAMGTAAVGPADVLAALFWDPAGAPSELLERLGRTRSAALDIVTGSGRMVPVAPTTSPLPAPAEREAVALGHSFVGDDHVLLALLSDEPDDRAGRALRRAGASHDRLAARVADMIANCDPPVPVTPGVTSARPNPRCRELVGRAEGLSAMLGDGVIGSTDGLLAYLWQDDGQPVLTLEALETSVPQVLAALAELDVVVPAVPVPHPDHTPWGERVYVPAERMKEVVARLSADLPPGTWGFNRHDGREWVVAHAIIDLVTIVNEVVAS
jgi:ATP-dependent Clp protease ATP-binding subunit ClpA